MIKIILCFPKSISISQPGFMCAEPACRRGEGNAVSPSAQRQDRKCFAAMHMMGTQFSYCSCLLPRLMWLLCPYPPSNCLGHSEPPVEIFSQCFPPSRFATGHAAFPAGTATGTQLPGSTAALGASTGSGNIFRIFLNGIVISHRVSKSSVRLQEFKAGQTNSLASWS